MHKRIRDNFNIIAKSTEIFKSRKFEIEKQKMIGYNSI